MLSTNNNPQELLHKDLTESIIGIFFDVYNKLGHGFMETVYENAMLQALRAAGYKAENQVSIPVYFQGQPVGDFRADILVNDLILIELKAVRFLDNAHKTQTQNYLRATRIEVALLMNFGPKPQFKRLVFENRLKKDLSV